MALLGELGQAADHFTRIAIPGEPIMKRAVITFDDCAGPWSVQSHTVVVFEHNGEGFTQEDLDSGRLASWVLNADGSATLKHFGAGANDSTRWGARNAKWS